MKAANDNVSLGTISTTADVMVRLRVSRKTLYILVAKHLPGAARVGRDYRFEEADILTIWRGMKSSCVFISGNEPPANRTGSSGGRTTKGKRSTKLQKLLTKKRPKRSA
ncbi:excisionase family DNA binding protein [Bradyrhizobium japonicum]|uniref:helix-turn-helix domain-containing protein n=1 Tax=Bradyrhizobium TaxID=374 RepID=UPI0004B790D2|nr:MULTISPECIES: helix-turn-helix domain-containing protein [Bradyrhizobium]MBR0948148.1 helix-turn-helix domain-containing protein [Bradyrhizobium liaoningense]MDI2076162.1 helix-turn-helix domain-containing protein [Bradyrhizobium sp. Mp27]